MLISLTIILALSGLLILKVNGESSIKKKVLIINSYSEGISWTQDENDGILEKLGEAGKKNDISVEFMDWKTYPTNENIKRLYDYMKYKYADKKIDLLLTTDDAALKFALDYRDELFSNAPVIFCGVNKSGAQALTKGKTNVTGVVEELDAEGTIKVALDIDPNIKNIYVVFDNTESGVSTWELTKKAANKVAPEIKLIPLNRGTYEYITATVKKATNDSIILITTFYSDEKGNVLGFEYLTEIIARESKVPVYHLYDFGLGYGAVGGSMLSGRVQGELAGEMAVKFLEGVGISNIPIYDEPTTKPMFDYKMLKHFKVRSDKIPRGSEIINKPYTIIEEYRNYVISAAIIFVLLICFILILIFYLNKINNIKLELAGRNTELSGLYEELSASGKELENKYNELTVVQKNLQESEARYRQLYEKMLNGYIVFEPVTDENNKLKDLKFIEWNPSFANQAQIDTADMTGKTWTEVFGYRNRDQIIYERVLKTGETEQFETYNQNINAYYLVNAFKINDNQVGVVFENITNYKLALREVRRLNEELEVRVVDRTRELQDAVNQLEAFTYTVSHDLKSPLRATESYIRIILEDYGKSMQREASEMLANVKVISGNMIQMIERLFAFSTATRTELRIEEINMESEIISCFNDIKAAYPNRNISLIIETGLPVIRADRVLLHQAVNNIFSNAIKFTKIRENAQIRIGGTLTESEYLFYFRDNGVGFDMKYSKKLFGIFQRLHSNNEFEGSGIGLVTIKKIVEKHGGRTWIEGEPGVGTTLYFTVPYMY